MQTEDPTSTNDRKSRPFKVRLPGFVSDEEIGLGDAVKRVTYAMGINSNPVEDASGAPQR